MDFTIENHHDIAILTLANPKKMNSLSPSGFTDLGNTVNGLSEDENVRAIIITGTGPAFSAGAGLDDLLASAGNEDGTGIDPEKMNQVFDESVNYMMRCLMNCNKPIVSAVNGIAAGGGVGLALIADIVFATEDSRFMLPFIPNLSIVPDCGTSWLVTRVLGRGRALPSMMLGRSITASQALNWGMIWEVTSAKRLVPAAMLAAEKLARGPINAYKSLRQVVDAASMQSLDAQLDLEKEVNIARATTPDFVEGLSAFMEKRHANFGGRSPLEKFKLTETDTMIFFDCPSAPSPRRTRMLIAEKGLDIDTRMVNLGKKEHLSDEYLALNPRATVPAFIAEDGNALTENVAIALYLDEKFPETPMLGNNAEDKAMALMWTAIIEQQGGTPIADALRNSNPHMKGRAITGPVDFDQIPDLVERSKVRIGLFYDMIEDRLSGRDWIATDELSFADITAFVFMEFAKAIKMFIPEGNKATQAWYARIAERPSAKL